jgi:microcystin-dependent protein
MSLLLLLRNRPAPKSVSTKDYNIWDQESLDADVGPQQQKTVEATLQNQLGFLMRKTWRTPTPVGCIMQYVGNNAPIGWLFCDGAAYSQQEYSDLYAIIGTTYGDDKEGTFRVPNFAGRVPIGAGTINDGTGTYVHSMGDSSGETYHTLTVGEMPEHNHTYNDVAWREAGGSGNIGYGSGSSDGDNRNYWRDINGNLSNIPVNLDTGSKGGDQKHNNMQPYVVVRYIIRY